MLNFAAPELFDKSSNCDQPDADGYEVHVVGHDRKTVQTDVYAFGCLCYAVSLDPLFGAQDGDSSRYSSIPCPFKIYPNYKFPDWSKMKNVQHD